jgi:predicted DNA-binding transcriptional regulator AlpA
MPRPAIIKTEGEKLQLARSFLERRGFCVTERLLNKDEVCELLGCSRSHIGVLARAGDFPIPYDIGAFKAHIDVKRIRPRWRHSDIEAWLRSRRKEGGELA